MKESQVLTEASYYILLSLLTPNHGYGIMQQTAKLSQNRVTLAAGTLYGALQNLESKGWIAAKEGAKNSRKKEYVITDAGTFTLKQELKRLQELVKNGEALLCEK